VDNCREKMMKVGQKDLNGVGLIHKISNCERIRGISG
jgi:hypothetical protein